jgi:ATP-binding cassette subfamily F protein 3
MLLLDEPTNHLDIEAREALMNALNEYKGAVILVSHDPHLVECVSDRLWLVAEGTVKPYDDDLDGYRKLVIQQRKRERENEKQKNKGKSADKEPKPEVNLTKAEKEAARLEKKVAELTASKDDIENDLANACAGGDATQIKRLENSYGELEKSLRTAEKELEAAIAKL